MSDFQRLQQAIAHSTAEREHDRAQCEGFLNALYHAVRTAEGPGQPLNNVSLELVAEGRVRPVPVGGWHAAWLRLGHFEIHVRVRREGVDFVGEYGEDGSFRAGLSEQHLRDLATRLMAEGLRLYGVRDIGNAPN